ncbi:hypothetical protein ACQ86F_35165 [Streptomyces venezuelae ATCC 10712]
MEHGTFDQLMDPSRGTGAFREAYDLQARQFLAPTVPGQTGPATSQSKTEEKMA